VTAPLTEAEKAAAEVLAGHHNASDAAYSYSSAAFAVEARAVVAAVRPELLAEFYAAMAEATRKNGSVTAEGFDALALLARQSLSRPTSEETRDDH
jgi:hypothetical protein